MSQFKRFHVYTPSGNIEYSDTGIFLYYDDVADIVKSCINIEAENKHLNQENAQLKSMVDILTKKIEILEK